MSQNLFQRFGKSIKQTAMVVGVLCAAAAAPSIAEAAPIGNASFGIGAGFTLPSGANLGNTNSIFISNGGMIWVTAAGTGDLSGLVNIGATGTMQDLPDLAGFTPINGFISLGGGISVDVSTLTVVSQTAGPPGFINISGDAVIHAPGYDPTQGTIAFSGNNTNPDSYSIAVTTSASTGGTTSSGVPEPASLALLGLGVLALFAVSRRREGVAALPTA